MYYEKCVLISKHFALKSSLNSTLCEYFEVCVDYILATFNIRRCSDIIRSATDMSRTHLLP